MSRKAMVCLMALCLLAMPAPPVDAKTRAEKDAAFAEKVKASIVQLGVGEDARVEVRLRDRRKLAGYIQMADADGFVVTDLTAGNSTRVPYGSVAKVKGHNLSTGAKVAIMTGVLVGIVLLIWTIIYSAAIND